MSRSLIAAATAAAALAAPAAAQAHVTIQPGSAAAGAYTVVAVRVPNERDDAATTKIRLRLPAGFTSISYEAQPGWTATVRRAKLATPIQTDDGPITERVASVTFTGTGRGLGRIAPGQFKDFRISVRMPDRPGATLAFPAIQTYAGGEVVRWTGAPGSDRPAPTVTLTAAAGGH